MGGKAHSHLEGAALLEHIFGKCLPPNERGCRLWTGQVNDAGYGMMHWRGRKWRVHRLTYNAAHPDAPLGERLGRHECDTPLCAEPGHIEPGTHADNVEDKIARGRQPIGSAHGRSKLNELQVLRILADPRHHSEIGVEYGVSRAIISLIKAGKVWKHVKVNTGLGSS